MSEQDLKYAFDRCCPPGTMARVRQADGRTVRLRVRSRAGWLGGVAVALLDNCLLRVRQVMNLPSEEEYQHMRGRQRAEEMGIAEGLKPYEASLRAQLRNAPVGMVPVGLAVKRLRLSLPTIQKYAMANGVRYRNGYVDLEQLKMHLRHVRRR